MFGDHQDVFFLRLSGRRPEDIVRIILSCEASVIKKIIKGHVDRYASLDAGSVEKFSVRE